MSHHAFYRAICLVLFICILGRTTVLAQQELMLHQSSGQHLWHKNSLNPAFFPAEKRIAIGLPAFSLDQRHSGDIAIKDFLREEGDKTYLDLGGVIEKLDPQNTFDFDQRIETVSFGLKMGNWAVSLGHAIRFDASLTYPKSLAQLLWNGNGPYVGQTLDIAPTVNYLGWNELGIGLSRKIAGIRVGARLKYLSGIAALESDADHRKATVHTDNDIYQLTLETDYAFRSGLLVTALDTAGLGYDLKTEKLKYGRVFSKNTGLAADFGITAKLGERLHVEASVLDLGGSLKWKDNANYFRSNGKFEYDGVEIPGIDIINGSDSIDIENQLDTLNDVFRFQKTTAEFSSDLPTRIYLGSTFKLSEKLSVGAVFSSRSGRGRDQSAFGANVHLTPFRWLSAGAMYSLNDASKANIGFSLGLRLGPFQSYFVSDNLLDVFRANASPALNLRAGASLVF